jgi:protein involved in polysaccharide export with SLBB domain
VLALLLPVGCRADKRITLVELTKLEQEIAEVPDVPLEHEELALTDFRPYRVRSRDVLAIRLTGLQEQDRYAETILQARVHDDGTITLPVVGSVKVAELDLGEVEQAVVAAHVPDVVKDLSVYVELVGPDNTTVLVLGAAGIPGLVKLGQNERNPLYALAAAGGFSPTSSGRVYVRPIRPEREEVTYDLNDVNDVRRALLGPPLESGDVLVVEAADESVVYLSGLLNAPGPIPIPPRKTISVLRAIAASGGLVDFLEPKEATLWRRLADGSQVQVRVDLAAIRAGYEPDLALRAGDILDVPHTAETRFRQWFAQNITIGPFGVRAVYDPVADYRTRILRDRNGSGDSIIRQSLLQSLGAGVSELLIPPVTPPAAP